MTSRLIIGIVLVLLSVTVLADPPRPEQPYPITSNEKAFLDRRVQEIYRNILDYLDTLNQLRRDTANAAMAKANLYDDTASIALFRINLYDDTASQALWNTGNNISVKRVNADTVKSRLSSGDLYLEVGTGIVVIRDFNDNGPGQLYFREKPSNGTSYIGLEAPASLAASKLFVLPAADGTSGQVISTNALGTLSFVTRATQAEIHDSLVKVYDSIGIRGLKSLLWSKEGDTLTHHGWQLLQANVDSTVISFSPAFAGNTYAVTLTPCIDVDGSPVTVTTDSLGLSIYNLGHLSTSSFVVHKKYSESFRIQWIASGR